MKHNCLVSVIIPCYNYGKYLSQAVDSVLNQTYKNIEVIIINDGSTDNTDEIAKRYEEKQKSVAYISQRNQGIVVTRNTGLSLAKGDYLLQLDADDWLDSNYVEETLRIAQKTNADIVYTDYKKFGNQTETSSFPEYNLDELKNHNFIHISSLLKVSSLRGFMFDQKLSKLSHEDWEFFLNLCLNGRTPQKCTSTFLHYRIHQSARNNQHINAEQRRSFAKVYSYVIDKHKKQHLNQLNYLAGRIFADWYTYTDRQLVEVNKNLLVHQEMVRLKDNHINHIEAELHSIKNHKLWKAAKKAASLKHKIKRL